MATTDRVVKEYYNPKSRYICHKSPLMTRLGIGILGIVRNDENYCERYDKWKNVIMMRNNKTRNRGG